MSDVLSDFIDEQATEIQKIVSSEFTKVNSEAVWKILKELVTLEGTKQPLKREVLIEKSGFEKNVSEKIIQLLENSRIIRIIDGDCEVSHDTLAIKIAEKFSTEERHLLRM